MAINPSPWIPRPNKIDGVATIADGFIVDGLIVSTATSMPPIGSTTPPLTAMKINGLERQQRRNSDGDHRSRFQRVYSPPVDDFPENVGLLHITVTNATVCSGMERRRDQPGLVRQLAGGRLPESDGVYVVRADWSLVQHAQLGPAPP